MAGRIIRPAKGRRASKRRPHRVKAWNYGMLARILPVSMTQILGVRGALLKMLTDQTVAAFQFPADFDALYFVERMQRLCHAPHMGESPPLMFKRRYMEYSSKFCDLADAAQRAGQHTDATTIRSVLLWRPELMPEAVLALCGKREPGLDLLCRAALEQ